LKNKSIVSKHAKDIANKKQVVAIRTATKNQITTQIKQQQTEIAKK
jgi:hypothetical protein